MPAASGPLAGLTVIDWTHVLSGPFVGYQLALLGADVIRIERPGADDIIRAKAADPVLARLGLGEAFIAQGSGKRSVALDLRDERARTVMARLITQADVLVENFRPGKLAKLGFDPARLIEQHPQLVVCSVTGFGQQSGRRAYDHVVQAASGLMAANAPADGRPQRVGFPVIDYAAGQQAALAITAALLRRSREAGARTKGEWVQVSMLEAALTLMAPAYATSLVSGVEVPRSASTAFSGNPLSGTFESRQGFLAIVCNAPEQGEALIRALGYAGATEVEVRALAQAAAASDVAATHGHLALILARRSAAEWETLLSDAGVPVSLIATPIEAARSVSAAWPVVSLDLPGGPRSTSVPGIGFYSTEPLTVGLRPPARLGQHTREVLAEVGLDAAMINAMLAEGVAAEPD